MVMKKIICIVSVTILLLTIFTGCSGNKNNKSPQQSNAKEFSTQDWDKIFTISDIDEYSYSKVIGNDFEWAKGNIKNNSENDFSEIRISIDVDFGDKKRNFSDIVYNLKSGQTSTFTVTLTQSEQKSITRMQIPICKVIEVKYDLNEYRVKLNKPTVSTENTSTSNASTTTPTYSNREIKAWMQGRYDYYDKIEGRYCGDKYTKTIYQEAATKFGLTLDEIDKIW